MWLYKGVYRCEYCTVFSVLCSLEYIMFSCVNYCMSV